MSKLKNKQKQARYRWNLVTRINRLETLLLRIIALLEAKNGI